MANDKSGTDWRPFAEARAYAQGLGLGGNRAWVAHWRTNARPADIPSAPNSIYKGKGWISWGDWLGTGTVAPVNKKYRPFLEAKAYVQSFGLKTSPEWDAWSKTSRPADIPSNPHKYYKDSGWAGYGDWLGVYNYWNRNNVLSFLKSLREVVDKLEPREILAILRQNGLLSSRSTIEANASLLECIRQLSDAPDPRLVLDEVADTVSAVLERQAGGADAAPASAGGARVGAAATGTTVDEDGVGDVDLHLVDRVVGLRVSDDPETVEFLICNRVQGLWQRVFGGGLDVAAFRLETGGEHFRTIQERFLTQYDGASNLPVPEDYRFKHQPNLMQKLTAYRVQTDRRVGNFSGTGAGKTVSALLASRVIGARTTVIIAHNSTVRGWKETIEATFPDHAHKFRVINYEKFSQGDRYLLGLLELTDVDMVVLDEIHMVKRRQEDVDSSRRRTAMLRLLAHAADLNPALAVLGMSATPVINDLQEGKVLLEMIRGEEYPELATAPTQENANHLHQKLMVLGLRWKPKYNQQVATTHVGIHGDDLAQEIIEARGILGVEQVLARRKLETMIHLELVVPGTMIYCHYVEEVADMVHRELLRAGHSVGLYTGGTKSGLDEFREGRKDVLVASAPVGTGVDGLQSRRDRMIIISLPWTHAGYEQLVGRIHRQGSAFDSIEVIIPYITIGTGGGDVWSWDRLRWERVLYKQGLADAAVDGHVFRGSLVQPKEDLALAKRALERWIVRVEADETEMVIQSSPAE